MSTRSVLISWGPWVLGLLLAGAFPGPAAAERTDAPPAAPRAVLLHLDSESGDDTATGASWDEPLRSLEEVQRRIDEGHPVSGLRLAAGWYPGALRTDRPLRIEGGFPPVGLRQDGAGRLRGEPALYRSVLDALGRSAVIETEGASLSVDGVILSGGWSLEGGAIAANGTRVVVTRSELADSGPALLGCRDCPSVHVSASSLARGSTAAIELRGDRRTELSLRDVSISQQRRAVVADAPADVELTSCRLEAIEREALSLPPGASTRLSGVEGLSEPSGAGTPSRERARSRSAR